MGLFTKREECAICGGKVKGLFPWKLEGKLVCKECHGEVDVQTEENIKTIDAFKRYREFRAENQKLAEGFNVDFSLSTVSVVFDYAQRLMCFDKKLNKTIFKEGDVVEFTIAEDNNIILRGNANELVKSESLIPKQVQMMRPIIDQAIMNIQRYEHEMKIYEDRAREARANGQSVPMRPNIRRPEMPRPFEDFIITLRFDHPYWNEKVIKVSAPNFNERRPSEREYMADFERKHNEMIDLANAIVKTMFPSSKMSDGSGTVASAPSAAAEKPSEEQVISIIRDYKKLLDEGIITQEEFDGKKKALLGL